MRDGGAKSGWDYPLRVDSHMRAESLTLMQAAKDPCNSNGSCFLSQGLQVCPNKARGLGCNCMEVKVPTQAQLLDYDLQSSPQLQAQVPKADANTFIASDSASQYELF